MLFAINKVFTLFCFDEEHARRKREEALRSRVNRHQWLDQYSRFSKSIGHHWRKPIHDSFDAIRAQQNRTTEVAALANHYKEYVLRDFELMNKRGEYEEESIMLFSLFFDCFKFFFSIKRSQNKKEKKEGRTLKACLCV